MDNPPKSRKELEDEIRRALERPRPNLVPVPPGQRESPGVQRNERLRQLLENMRAFVVESAPGGRSVYISPGVTPLLGYQPEELLERPAWEWIHQDDLPLVVEVSNALRHTTQTAKVVLRARHRRGHWIWLESTTTQYQAPDGEVRTLTFARDVTDVKETGQALRETEERYRQLTENTSDVVIEVDQDGRFLFVSPSANELFGRGPEAMTGGYLGEFAAQNRVHPKDQERLLQGFRRTVAEGRRKGVVQFRGTHRDGTYHWFESSFRTFRAADGSWRAVVTTRDIDERVRAQEELRESEERYRIVVGASQEIIVEADAEGRVVYASPALEAVTGFRVDEIVGTTPLQLIHPDDVETSAEIFLTTVETGAPVAVPPMRIRHRDGTWLWIEGRSVAYQRADGETRVLSLHRDISERIQAEEQRRELEEQMRQSQKLEGLGVMAGGIAHDFNNLLTPILGDASLALMDLPEDSPLRGRLRRIQKAAQRAAALTNQMLAYAGTGPMVVEQLDVSGLVDEMSQLLESTVGRSAVVHRQLVRDLPPVRGDASQLSQVMMNLITNASDAVRGGEGNLHIRTGRMWVDRNTLDRVTLGPGLPEGSYVFFEVEDDGCGMDERTRSRIFDPFYTTKFTGRGLGLAAVLGIVRGHHGAIEIESRPGEGTRFRVLLPASEERATAASGSASDVDTTWRGSGRILVVDDDEAIRELVRDALERSGFQVACAACGADGLRLFAEDPERIAVVLLDRTMPAGDGEQTLERIRAIDPGARVILVSGYSRERATQGMAEASIAGFLQKPFLPEELLAAVRRALDA